MPELSEFIGFVSEKSGIKKSALIEKEVTIHRMLKELSSKTAGKYVLKGGTCLIKCYFGYYRFSVDLDFTWKNPEVWRDLGKKRLRRSLLDEIGLLGSLLEKISEEICLEFKNDHSERRYFEFGGGGRMVTMKLWKGTELIKVQVNFLEDLLFPVKKVGVMTLLSDAKLSRDEKAYFKGFLEFYSPFEVQAYDEREILCEKVRAILTRRKQRLRDFYDVFVLDRNGFNFEEFREEIIKKIRASLYYKKYRENLERNKRSLGLTREVVEDPFERDLFVVRPPKSFERFLDKFIAFLKDIATEF